jgi:TonB-linked SusC/RagA family outer membrane protein
MKKIIYITAVLSILLNIAFVQAQPNSTTQQAGISSGNTDEKLLNTAAIHTISGDEIQKSSAISLDDALFGKLLGLSILQSGGFESGSSSSYFIRGLKTLSNNGILILVDGLERPVSDLALEEVESVSVLKDAAAVAIYGFKGINGVLSIKTKRGIKQKLDVKVSYDYGITEAFRMPKMVDGYTYAKAYNEAKQNDGSGVGYNAYEMDMIKTGGLPYLYPNVNWMDETLQKNGKTDKINLTIRGGDAKVKYFTMLNLSNCRGLLANTETNAGYSTQLKYSQANIRTNFDLELSSTSHVELNLMGVFYQSNQPAGLTANDLISTLYQLPATAFPVKAESGLWGGSNEWGNKNPMANIASSGYGQDNGRTIYADLRFVQDLKSILPGLSASVRVGYDNYSNYWDKRSRGFQYEINRLNFDVNGIPTTTTQTLQGDVAGNLTFSTSLNREWRNFNRQASVDYKHSFGAHNMSASLFYANQMYTSDGQNNTYNAENAGLNLHWDYKTKYIADMVFNMSGSNTMAYLPNHYGPSAVASGGWILSNESFLKSVKQVDFLKIRASLGLLTSDYIPSLTLTEQKFDGGGSYYFTDSYTSFSGTREGMLGNPNPLLEKALSGNIGLDAQLFKNFTLQAEAFYQKRFDILQPGVSSSVLGIAAPYQNSGIVDSKGFEVGLDYRAKFNDLLVSVGGKYTFSKSNIVAYLEEPKAYPYLSSVGRSVSQVTGLEAIGFFADQAEINAYQIDQSFSILKPGDIKYKDQNGDNIINENDIVSIAQNSSVPEVYYSFNVGLEYKNLGFDMDFQGVGNFSKMVTTTGLYRPMTNGVNVSEHYYDNRWVSGADNSAAKYPALSTISNSNNERNSTVWLQDLSYVKLRNCELYYYLPKQLIRHIAIDKAKIYVRGSNLLSLDKIKIVDPENTGARYPTVRSVNVGVSLNF